MDVWFFPGIKCFANISIISRKPQVHPIVCYFILLIAKKTDSNINIIQ